MVFLSTLTDAAHYNQRVELDGVNFYLDLRWNARLEAWQLSLFDADQNPLVQGLTLVSNWPVLKRFKSKAGMPAGDIMALDETSTIDAAGYDELGEDRPVNLVYIEAADLV